VINDSTICHGVKAKLEAGNVEEKYQPQQRFAEIRGKKPEKQSPQLTIYNLQKKSVTNDF